MEGESILATQQVWAVMPFLTASCGIFFFFQYSSWFDLSHMLYAFDDILNVRRLHILHGSFLLLGVSQCWVFYFVIFIQTKYICATQGDFFFFFFLQATLQNNKEGILQAHLFWSFRLLKTLLLQGQ